MQIEPEIKKKCNLMEALELLSFGWLPCEGNDELLLQENRTRIKYWWKKIDDLLLLNQEREYVGNMYISIAKVENLLRNHKISVSGEYTANIFNRGHEDMSIADAIIKSGTPKIDLDLPNEIVLKYDAGNDKEVVFLESIFNVSELTPYAPNQEGLGSARRESNGYTTPYVEIMLSLMEEGLAGNPNSTITQLSKEIKSRGKEQYQIDISTKKAEVMASLIRPLSAQKGGCKKTPSYS